MNTKFIAASLVLLGTTGCGGLMPKTATPSNKNSNYKATNLAVDPTVTDAATDTNSDAATDTATDTNATDTATDSDTATATDTGSATDTGTSTSTSTSTNVPPPPKVNLGIAFEDWIDWDYNDAVLCMSGFLKVDGANIISLAKQSISVTRFSATACKERVDILVTRPDGSKDNYSYINDETSSALPLNLDFGSLINIKVTLLSGQACQANFPANGYLDLTSPRALVQYDTCRNTPDKP